MSKQQYSIDLLRKAEPMALKINPKGFWLAFSGGKDSQALYHIAKEAGVKFEAHYSLTTIDPPELVWFIKKNYPDVIIDRPKLTFAQLIKKNKILPLKHIRYCCANLKESNGRGFVTLIGIRHAESTRRAKRNEVEILGRKFSGTLDQFNRDNEIDQNCFTGSLVVSPIIHWTDNDIWTYIRSNSIEYCQLYDEGWHRIGCLFCPMASKRSKQRDSIRYPKYRAMIIKAIKYIMCNYGYMNDFPDATAEDVFEAWISNEPFKKYLECKKITQKLDL